MAERDTPNHTGRNVALVGGGALLVWLLLRGKGWGLGGGGGGGEGENGTGVPDTSATKQGLAEAPRLCKVFIRAHRIDLDGAPAALPAVVARCRAAGNANVQTSGGASIQSVIDTVRALQAAGVTVSASPRVWSALNYDENMTKRKP